MSLHRAPTRGSRGEAELFTLLRLRQRAGLFAGLALIAAVAVGTATGIAGMLSSAATTGVRAVLGEEPGSELALRVALPLAGSSASDADEQDDLATTTIRQTFRDPSEGGIPLSVVRMVESVSTVTRDAVRTSVGVAEVDDIAETATLTAGTWPSDASQATMQADAATALDVGIGDVLTLDERVGLMIVGTWRVDDADAPRWMGDLLWTTGRDDRSIGPIVVGEGVWDALGITPQVKWTIIPAVGELEPSDLAATDAAWESLPAAFSDAGLGLPSRTGRFVLSAREAEALVAALQTAAPLALVVLGMIAALAIWELAGLLARSRMAETALLWARGATARGLAARTAGEAAILAMIGAVLGAAAAMALLLGLPDASGAALAAGAWAAVTAVAVSAGAFALRTGRSAGSVGTAAARGSRADRTQRYAAAGALALVAAAAAVSTWQLLANGPITITRTGRAEVDPVTLVAPALVLAAIVLGALYMFPVLARAAAASAGRGTGPLAVTALRGVARRPEGSAVPIVMVGLAVGQLIVAAGYGATWAGAFTQAQELRFGAAVSLDGPSSGLSDADLDAAASASAAIAPLRTDDLLIGGERAALVGVAAPALARLGLTGAGAVDPDALATAIAPTTEPLLPDAATDVSVQLSGTDAAAVTVWLSDSLGRLRSIPLETTPTEDGLVATGQLPGGNAPWRFAAVDAIPAATDARPARQLALTSITTDAGEVGGIAGSAVSFRNGLPTTAPGTRGGPTAPAEPGTLVRFLPAPPAAGVVLSRALADRLGTRIDAPLTLELGRSSTPIQTSVVAIAPAIPGTEDSSAILIDAAVVDAARLASDASPLAASRAWVGTTEGVAATATALRDVLPPSVTVDTVGTGPVRAMLASGPAALWFAALAGATLAIAGLIAVCATQLRDRRGEIAVLRALGIAPRGQSALRRRELAIVEVWAVAAGVAAGATVVLLAVATLARTAVPGAHAAIPTAVRIDAGWATAAIVLLSLALFAVIVGYAALVARSAATGRDPTRQELT